MLRDVYNVDKASIDPDDITYRIGPASIPESLKTSVNTTGIINPVKLLRKTDKYTIITGWKRFMLCEDGGYVPAFVYDPEKTPEIQRLLIIISDNYGKLNELQKAEIILKLRDRAGLNADTITREYLSFMDISPSPSNYDKYISVSLLGRDVKESYYSGRYSFEHLELFSELGDAGICDIVFEKLFSKIRFNLNESREVIKFLKEVSLREGISVPEVVDSILYEENCNPTKNDFRKILKQRRNPKLATLHCEFSKILESLGTDNNTRLKYNSWFETNDLEFNINFKTSSELKSALSKISNEISTGNVDKLLNFIKKGGKS